MKNDLTASSSLKNSSKSSQWVLDSLDFQAVQSIGVMKYFILILVALALAPLSTFGGDTNAAGTWKWSLAGQNGDTILKLKQDGEKLTGSYTNQFGKAEITDGSLKDGEITFKVKREFNGQPFIIKYS